METQQTARAALIDRLASDLRPVRRLWPVNTRLAVWLLLEAILLILVVVSASRPDLSEKVHSLRYVFEVAAFVVAGTLAAILALRAAIPGREPTKGELASAVAVAAIAILFVFSEPMAVDVPLSGFIRAGLRCAFCTGLVAAIPWVALLWAVRRGTPTVVATAGGMLDPGGLLF